MNPLCDTNILSELVRPRPNPGVLAWAGGVKRIAVSVITLEEIHFGLSWRPNPRIQSWFERFVEGEKCALLPVTPAIALHAGRLRGGLRAAGRTHTQADLLVAATAAAHDLTLVTRNTKDFRGCDIPLLNPFA